MKPTTTAYTREIASINCTVKHALRWKFLLIRERKKVSPLFVRVYPGGGFDWSWSKEDRHDVIIESANQPGLGVDINVSLIISDVVCRDSKTFMCTLVTETVTRTKESQLVVAGMPDNKIHLSLGPSIIEDKALRLTATWNAGYPRPWTNITWLAIDASNKIIDLDNYGQYREHDIQIDHQKCETRLKNSFVIFPTLALNDSTVMVRPNLDTIKHFVTSDMAAVLDNVQPGSEKILVIPLDYCETTKEKDESAIPHPYTDCHKYVWCLSGDLIVQQCPQGTCFYRGISECV